MSLIYAACKGMNNISENWGKISLQGLNSLSDYSEVFEFQKHVISEGKWLIAKLIYGYMDVLSSLKKMPL